MSQDVLRMENISKSFGGIKVLKNVNFNVREGSIHGLVGENGAGKSTLMKILTGIYTNDAGEIYFNNQKMDILDYAAARRKGIVLIPQELSYVPQFSVAENIFLGREPLRRSTFFVDWKSLYRETEVVLRNLNIQVDPKAALGGLSVSEQQMVVIAKNLWADTRLIIMDEPTARLGIHDSERLLAQMENLRERGISIVFITHRLEEIISVCDEVTVLRNGEVVGTRNPRHGNTNELIRLMVNRETEKMEISKKTCEIGKEVLRVKGLGRKNYFQDVNFYVHEGEILGIFGLVGAGRTEMVRSLCGIDPKDEGEIYVDGDEVHLKSMKHAVEKGLALAPEERRTQGLVLDFSVRNNLTLNKLKEYSKWGLINHKKEKLDANQLVDEFGIDAKGTEQKLSNLSGGNQQKIVLAKWISSRGRIFFLDEPTRGIDVGAKVEIYRLIMEMAAQGAAVVVISSEIPEIQTVCDRVLVMSEGQVSAELTKDELTPEKLLNAAILEKTTEELDVDAL